MSRKMFFFIFYKPFYVFDRYKLRDEYFSSCRFDVSTYLGFRVSDLHTFGVIGKVLGGRVSIVQSQDLIGTVAYARSKNITFSYLREVSHGFSHIFLPKFIYSPLGVVIHFTDTVPLDLFELVGSGFGRNLMVTYSITVFLRIFHLRELLSIFYMLFYDFDRILT